MGCFLPYATVSITGYKLATSFWKEIVYFCPFLKMLGAFSYCNNLVMINSEKEEKNPNQLKGSLKRKYQECCSQSHPGHFLPPKHIQFLVQTDVEYL